MVLLHAGSISTILTLLKIFGLNSSQSPLRTNKYLFLYSTVVAISYTILLILRIHFWDKYESTLQNMVTNLHLICYCSIILSTITTNWLMSKKCNQALTRLEIFDHYLNTLVFSFNHTKTEQVFKFSLCASSGIYLCLAAADCVVGVLTESDDLLSMISWLCAYIPITINFHVAVTIIFTMLLLNQRYRLLKIYLGKVLGYYSSLNVKQFTNFYLELNEISYTIVYTFSLQITTMFLLIFTTVTLNTYLLLTVDLSSGELFKCSNFLLIHCVEMVAVTFAHFSTKARVSFLLC